MANYQDLKDRIDGGETVILDGAVGTQLQDMGVPMHPVAWCGPANVTHPSSVIQMHERYIKAGADVITTNTFSTVRPMLENAGYGDYVREINARAAHNAQEARARAAVDRPVYVAASTVHPHSRAQSAYRTHRHRWGVRPRLRPPAVSRERALHDGRDGGLLH